MAVAIRACAEEVEAMKESVRLCIVHPDAREGMKEAGGKGEHGKRFMRRRLSRAERDFVWEHSHRICYMCKVDLPRLSDWHVEHVIAFSKDPQVWVVSMSACACTYVNFIWFLREAERETEQEKARGRAKQTEGRERRRQWRSCMHGRSS